jgi:hypothetical protein
MKVGLVLALVCAAALASAQGGPVTVAEAGAALERVDASIRGVLRLPAGKPSGSKATRPITRAEVIARLDALFESYRPRFVLTPRPFRTEPAIAARFNKDAKTLASIHKLSRFGCIGPVGPLVTGSGENISVEHFGETLGLFMSQIAALTYTAEPKWTPALMPPLGG